MRTLLESYFRSPSELFVSFTHLVCRSAIAGTSITHKKNTHLLLWEPEWVESSELPGDQEGRLDLSHPVHVDNCLLEPDTRQCWREQPAFIHRDLRYVSPTTGGQEEGKGHRRSGFSCLHNIGCVNVRFKSCAYFGRSGVMNVDLQGFSPPTVPFSTSTTTLMEETCSSPAGTQRPSQ